MDYVEHFKTLKKGDKYSHNLPHKAILLLSIIDMYEAGIISDNEIYYNDTLKDYYDKMWSKVMPNAVPPSNGACIAFWYLENECFWHTVPKRGKEDVLQLMKNPASRPSHSKIIDSVKYAELDESLYLLMTLPSSRSSLKRTLLETYTSLSKPQIDRLSCSSDNYVDHSIIALDEYKSMLNSSKDDKPKKIKTARNDKEKKFLSLKEDIQYVLIIEYYKFLKRNVNEREMLKEICPTVYDLYDMITSNTIGSGDIAPSVAFIYENFLADLKISLMVEDDSIEIIDSINSAIERFTVTEINQDVYELENDPYDIENINDIEIDSEDTAISDVDDSPIDFYVENSANLCSIFDHNGQKVYSTNGKLKIFHKKVYRFNYKEMCLTVKDIVRNDDTWTKGKKKLVAYIGSELYSILDKHNYIDQIEDFIEGYSIEQNRICVDGKWYNSYGNFITFNISDLESDTDSDKSTGAYFDYTPKGRLKNIGEFIKSPYDYLFILALLDFIGENQNISRISFDELACMMIANAWVISAQYPSIRQYDRDMVECIEYLIAESEENMDNILSWTSSQEEIYKAINGYPMAGVFEDVVDKLIETTPYNILNAWIDTTDIKDLVMYSIEFKNNCLYAIHPKKVNPYIEINPKWKRNLYNDNVLLRQYFKMSYLNYLGCLETK